MYGNLFSLLRNVLLVVVVVSRQAPERFDSQTTTPGPSRIVTAGCWDPRNSVSEVDEPHPRRTRAPSQIDLAIVLRLLTVTLGTQGTEADQALVSPDSNPSEKIWLRRGLTRNRPVPSSVTITASESKNG